MTPLVHNPPAALRTLLMILDPGQRDEDVVIASDLLARHQELDQDRLRACLRYLDQLLSDESVSNADLKGLLNRLAGRAWSVQWKFGADAKAARQYLEALQSALVARIG